jgi:hypothetical protein
VAIGEARARIAALRANAAGVRDRMTRDWDRQADALRTLLAP